MLRVRSTLSLEERHPFVVLRLERIAAPMILDSGRPRLESQQASASE
jgi:hypothetical protein